MALRLNANQKVYGQAARHLGDAVSVLSVAEGALGELGQIVQRQRELAQQAANGTYSAVQWRALQREVDALNDEFNRVVQSTTFNGRNLFEGTDTAVAIQAGFGTDGILTLALGSSLSRAQGDGMFTQIQTVGSWSGDAAAVSADLNGDGRDDLVTVGSGVVNVRLGMAYGTVSTTLLSSTGPAAGSAYNLDAIADFDGDGTLDLLAHDSLNAPSLECREIGMEASHLWLLRNSS